MVYRFENLISSSIPGIQEEPEGLGQHGGPQEARVHLESRTAPETDSTKNAVDVRIDFLPLPLVHQRFPKTRDLLRMEERLYLAVVSKEGRHIYNEVPDHREIREGLDEDRSALQVFDMRPARQDHLPIHPHGAGPANSSTTGISEGQTPVLFILDTQQGLQKIHLCSRFELKGFHP